MKNNNEMVVRLMAELCLSNPDNWHAKGSLGFCWTKTELEEDLRIGLTPKGCAAGMAGCVLGDQVVTDLIDHGLELRIWTENDDSDSPQEAARRIIQAHEDFNEGRPLNRPWWR